MYVNRMCDFFYVRTIVQTTIFSRKNTNNASWESENCTVYDSEIKGEYLGWFEKSTYSQIENQASIR